MNQTEIIRFIICQLHLKKEIAIQVIGRLNFPYLKNLPAEEASEEVEGRVETELFKNLALKLCRFYRMGNLKSPGEKKYTLISPNLIFTNTRRMYQDGNAYPLKKLVARYRGLCNLGSQSLAYAESQKELMTTSCQHPHDPTYSRILCELDPAQLNGYIVDLVINMPDVILPIM